MAHVDVEAGVAAVPAAHASCAGEGESEDTVHCCLPVTTPARAQCPVRSSSTTRGPPLSPYSRRRSLLQRSPEVTWQASPRRPLVLALLSPSPRAHSSLVSSALVTRAG